MTDLPYAVCDPRRFFCVSAVYPKDCGSRNWTQGTKVLGVPKFSSPGIPPPPPRLYAFSIPAISPKNTPSNTVSIPRQATPPKPLPAPARSHSRQVTTMWGKVANLVHSSILKVNEVEDHSILTYLDDLANAKAGTEIQRNTVWARAWARAAGECSSGQGGGGGGGGMGGAMPGLLLGMRQTHECVPPDAPTGEAARHLVPWEVLATMKQLTTTSK